MSTFGSLVVITVDISDSPDTQRTEKTLHGITESTRLARIAAAALYENRVSADVLFSGSTPNTVEARDIVLENTRRLPRETTEDVGLDLESSAPLGGRHWLRLKSLIDEQLLPALAHGDTVFVIGSPLAVEWIDSQLPGDGNHPGERVCIPGYPVVFTFDRDFNLQDSRRLAQKRQRGE